MDEIYGYVERITYQNGENGYTVAQLQEPNKKDLTCIVGVLPGIQAGETVRCLGHFRNHLAYGRQFEVKSHSVEAPADIVGIRKYLGSGLVKGIGPKFAERIVDRFGTETLQIIDQSPERLNEVEGIGRKRIELIKECWQSQRSIREVMVFLQAYGVSPAFAQKIYKTYGDQSVATVKNNPYALARDLFGVGFKTADKLASALGIAQDSPQRIDAGIEFVLHELKDDGHTCHPIDLFLALAREMLLVDEIAISSRLDYLQKENRIELADQVHEGRLQRFIWLRFLYASEVGIARELRRLRLTPSHLRSVDVEKALAWVQEKLQLKLAPQQQAAVSQAVIDKVQIITGGPGTGKSTITKAILEITSKLTSRILLCAPTGKAAKRMGEITGKSASTIHSLLEFDFRTGKFKRSAEEPLECDLLIVDEASMIDTLLMYSLLRAVPSHARLIFVGDIFQLPSVGAGNVLQDLMRSQCLPVTTLNEIFRQAAGSRIITNAHRIKAGSMPEIHTESQSDFYFLDLEAPEEILRSTIALVTQRLPKTYGFDPIKDIQILAPMKKGMIGTENLNVALQGALLKGDNPFFRNGRKFLVGDKVMQLRNDYKRNVFNGDVGTISFIDHTDQQLTILMDDREVIYEFADLDELTHAYAVSVHKYQGSECPCVVVIAHTTHFKLLQRNLLYTAVTRGKKIVVVVGNKRALSIAVANDEVKQRYTGLYGSLLEQNTKPLLMQQSK